MSRQALGLFILAVCLITASSTLTEASLSPASSNQAAVTDYLLQFISTYSYSYSHIRVGFPIQYSLASFEQTLDCFVSNSGQPNDYRPADCWIEPTINLINYYLIGYVVIAVDNITSTAPYFVLLRNIVNPTGTDLTSFFTVCIEKQNTTIQCDKTFARVLLAPASIVSSNFASFKTDPTVQVVGQGATYIFSLPINSLGSWYTSNELMSLRVILPSEFTTAQPLCSVAYNITTYQMTYSPSLTTTFPSRPNVIQCSKITQMRRYLSNSSEITLKIQTITNPLQAKAWTDTYFQVVRSIHNEVVEIIHLGSPIVTAMEQMIGSVKQTNMFRNSSNYYYFYLNHDLNLGDNSSIQIKIGNTSYWNIHSISILSGFTSPGTINYSISETSMSSSITIQNYGLASRKVQQCIAVNLTSPLLIGPQDIQITAKIMNKQVGIWKGIIQLNQTFGQFNLLSLSAVRKKTKLGANATGQLQLRFFLNYQLLPSDGLTNGSLQVSVYPQLTQPNPSINGVLKCYFKGIYQASDCSFDNSNPLKTKLTIVSPPLQAYQYSQIPIIVTTQGAIDEQHIGFPIDPLVTRYRFETQFYLYNSSTIPSQVFYSQWIADAKPMTTASIISLTHQCNQFTNVQVNLNMPILSPISLTRQLRLLVQFMSNPATGLNGWHPYLGYNPDKIYKEYPCVVTGLTGTRIKCDLYTFTTAVGDYDKLHINSDITGPFFIVYGFVNTIVTGTAVTIELPKIKIGSQPNIPAMVKVSILQETPAMIDPYVQLYFQNVTAFTTLSAITLFETVTPTSQLVDIPIQSWMQYNISWSPKLPATVKYIKYQISQPYFPSFSTVSSACSISTCFSAGLPANWIVQKPAVPLSAVYTSQTLSAFINTISFINSKNQPLPIHITTYDSIGNTIDKIAMFLNYVPQPLVGYFDFIEPAVYAGLSQWYSISLALPLVSVSSYPFLRLTLDSTLQFAVPIQCNSSTLIPYNQTGFIFIQQTLQSLIIRNIKQLLPGGTYQLNCRLQTAATKIATTLSPTIGIQLHHNYSINSSYVAYQDGIVLKQAPVSPALSKPYQFKISNPQIINQQPRINYVGPLFIDFNSNFQPNYTNNYSLTLKVTLSNHRYNLAGWNTPNGFNSDPLVCFLNNARCSCSLSSNPLSLSFWNPAIIIGSNKLQFTSQYVAPYNGIKFPGTAGHYSATLALINTTSSITLSQHSFFIRILPHDVLHFDASSIVKDIDTQSVYLVNFTLPAWRTFPTAYNDATNYSRIFVQFPTTVEGLSVFSSNLGGYQGLKNQRVGCSFLTGLTYLSPIAGKILQCRLIPPLVDSDSVRVEIINHMGFTLARPSLALFIFKVFNPKLAHRSFNIRVSIIQYEVATGYQIPIYQGIYPLFLDPMANNSSPLVYKSMDNQTIIDFFDPSLDVGDYGAVTIKAQTVSGTTLPDPFYVIYKLPSYLPPENNQLAVAFNPFKLCPIALFQLCVTAAQINYVMVKVRINPATFQVFIKNYPISISQKDSFFEALVIEQGRLTGKLMYNISGSFRWKSLQGNMIFNSVSAVGLNQKLTINKTNADIVVNFRTSNYIPASGTIQIVFPSSVQSIKPNCRSATAVGSTLVSASGASGQIGCQVQHYNHWIITSFQAIPANSLIIIKGFIDLPAVSGSIGIGQIISYADNHPSDIYSNGSRIDYVTSDFGLIVATYPAMNVNADIFQTQREVLRQGAVGQFRLLFSSEYSLKTVEFIQLSMYKKDIKNNIGGFQLTSRPKVCEFVRIDSGQRIGCFVDLQTETFIFRHEVVMYHLKPVQDLLPLVTYQIRLTSQDYNQPQGINYPTIPSTYKIDVLINHTQSGAFKIQQKYIQIYGLPFNKLILTQYNYMAGTYDPFWLEIIPAITIPITHQLIIQFPTLSNDGITRMFSDDLGWSGLADGAGLPFDIYDCLPIDNSFMNCRIFFGDYLRAVPAKIICGNLKWSLLAGQTLKIAFAITNPLPMTVGILSQISLPIFVYSYDPYLFQTVHYNTVNVGAYVNNANQISAPNGYFSTATNQLQTPNQILSFANNNARPLLISDSYVIKFNFPLRKNTKIPSACTSISGIVYGDAYYHQNLRTVICKLTTNPMPANAIPSSATMKLLGLYTPWYALTLQQRKVQAIATYHSSTDSQFINYFDFFPLLNPRSSSFATLSTFQMTAIIPHSPNNIACQRNDYIFTVRLQNLAVSSNFNLQYTKIIMIQFPLSTTSDYDIKNTDCLEHPSSNIEIISCIVDPSSRAILITIVPGVYHNGKIIAVETKGLAIRNPCTLWSISNINQWTVYFLSFENGTLLSPSINNAYLVINSLNMQSFIFSFSPQTAANVSAIYYTFDWFQIPYQRYFNQFLQYDVGQYSPFAFQIYFNSVIPAPTSGSFHTLTLTFGKDYIPAGNQLFADDLSIYTPVCYLMNTRIQRCHVDLTTNTTFMLFNFSLPATTNIHVYFSVEDPRDLSKNGYEYVGTEDMSKLLLTLNASGTLYSFQTLPFQAQQTQFGAPSLFPVRGITLGTIDYANCIYDSLNIIDMTFTVGRNDISALKFQIPMFDDSGAPIFGATYKNSFFNLQNGDEYPCGNNQVGITNTGNKKCYLFYGDYILMGSPIHIIMTDFNQGTLIKARLLLKNPSFAMVGAWFSIYVKAYTGPQDQYSLYGADFIGYWNFPNIFQICSGSYSANSLYGWNYLTPNFGLWRQNTQWNLVSTIPQWPYNSIPVGTYVMIQVPLYIYSAVNKNDDTICKVNFALGDSNSDDLIIVKNRQAKTEKAYFVKKWTGSWSILYFKCKHYANPLVVYYSYAKTAVFACTHTFQVGWPYTGSTSSASMVHFASTLNRTYVQIDMTPQINQIIAEGFIWDLKVDYILDVNINVYIGTLPFSSFSKCLVVEGIISSTDMPVCTPSGTSLTITKFTSFFRNNRLSSYRLKLQLQYSSGSVSTWWTSWNGYLYYYASLCLYASATAKANSWYIFSISTGLFSYYKPYRYYNWINNSPDYSCQYTQDPISYPPYYYAYAASTNSMNVNLLNVATNAAVTTLQLHFIITPKIAISMDNGYVKNYPQFRFFVNNYNFNCNSFSFSKFIITYRQGAFVSSYDYAGRTAMLSCPSSSQIAIFFYYNTSSASFGSIWGPGDQIFSTTESLQFDIEVSISGMTQALFYRDWVSITSYIDLYEYSSFCCCYGYVWPSWGSRTAIKTSFRTIAVSQDNWLPLSLASSLVVQPLTTNVGEPTQMMITLNTANLQFGPSKAKYLLLELSHKNNPFAYINDTTKFSRIECKCISDWNPGVVIQPECMFRPGSLTNMQSAITIDMQVGYLLNAKCYFPEWSITAGWLTITAKLVNDKSSMPTLYTNYLYYGGFYQTISNNVSFAATATNTATLIETSNPSLYGNTSFVNTFLNDYTLTTTFPASSVQPIIYIDFQKGGIIPNAQFCTNTFFLQCRVYTTLRHILVAQFKSSFAAPSNLVIDSNFAFFTYLPKHQESGTNAQYHLIARVIISSSDNFYSYKGSYNRIAANLLPTQVSMYIEPQKSTGTLTANKNTNIIISFDLGGQFLQSYITNDYARIQITCNLAAVLLTARGCTVSAISDPFFQFYCEILGSTILISNRYKYVYFNQTGLIQVVVGIVNPSVPINFTLKGYQYYMAVNNYGLSLVGSATYTPIVLPGTTMPYTSIKLYKFNTKVFSTASAPFRMGFKLSTVPFLPTLLSYSSAYQLVFADLNMLTPYSYFQCLFREYSLQPTSNSQTLFPNSYRNYKQKTQHKPLYVNCWTNPLNKTALFVQVPRSTGLKTDRYYQLVIMPVGPSVAASGFANAGDTWFKLMSLPDSCQYIDKINLYTDNIFYINKILIVSKRPLSSTALMIDFDMNVLSPLNYPSHYLDIVMRDLDLTSIKFPYNTQGSVVPCTLSSLFLAVAGRTQQPACIVQKIDIWHGTILMRVTQIGSIVAGNYIITFDDFLLPDLINPPLEDSSPFTICLRFHSTAVHYQKCFGQLFVIDYSSNALAQSQKVDAFTISNNTYGLSGIVAGLTVSQYPINSVGNLDQKLMMRVTSGYGSTTAAPIQLFGYTPLWYNAMVGLYIYRQSVNSVNINLTLSLINLINPLPCQKAKYSNSPKIQLIYYDKFIPIVRYTYLQTAFNSFVLQQAKIYASSVLYYDDVKQLVPGRTSLIYRLQLIILDSIADISNKQIDRIQISFDSNVKVIQRCWVESKTIGKAFQLDGACQTIKDNDVLLYAVDKGYNLNNLTIYVQMQLIGTLVTYNSTVYCKNNQIQYFATSQQLFTDLDLISTQSFPTLDFTQNMYTNYYYQQKITQTSISTPVNYLYFSLNLPEDLIHKLTVFKITLPPTIAPNNVIETRMVCEWLTVDSYGRRYLTGQHSICSFVAPILLVQSPFGGLLQRDGSGNLITYLLKIREFNLIPTLFKMPATSKSEQILLTHANSLVLKQDTLIVYPYNFFANGKLSVSVSTLTAGQLTTYDITFTPASNVVIGKQAILQLSIDPRYMSSDLGMNSLYSLMGIDINDQLRIDNANYNILYTNIPNKWVNGLPYSCYTSTFANAQQTCVHISSQKFRIVLLLQTGYLANTPYNWKIPLLLNPNQHNITFCLNLTLFTYQLASARPQKQLFYEIINPFKTAINSSSTLTYNFTSQAQANPIQSNLATINIDYGFPFVPDSSNLVQFKISNRGLGLIALPDFYLRLFPDPSYSFYFFKRINLVLAKKIINDGSTTINFGALEQTNQYAEYFGYDWVKVHSTITKQTTWNAGQLNQQLLPCVVSSTAFTLLQGTNLYAGSQFLQQLSFTTPCAIPINSTLTLQFNSSQYGWAQNIPCQTSFKSIGCTYVNNGSLYINFYSSVSTATTVIISLYLQSIVDHDNTSALSGFVFGLPGKQTSIVNTIAAAGIFPVVVASDLSLGDIQDMVVKPLYENTLMQLRGTIKPRYLPLSFIKINNPFSWPSPSNHKFIYRNNNSLLLDKKLSLNWIQTNWTVMSSNLQSFKLLANGIYNYQINTGNEYSFVMTSTYASNGLNNVSIGAVGQFYQFTYFTDSQIQYEEVYPLPVADTLTVINPILQLSQATALGLKFKVATHQINPGDIISISLDSHNLLQQMYQFTTIPIQCAEGVKGVLTASLDLICEIIQYPKNKQPMIINVFPKKIVPLNTQIQIWISPIVNPAQVMVAGVIVKVSIDCLGEQRCTIYEARGYYRTISGLSVINYGNSVGTFATSNTQVLQKTLGHTFTFNSRLSNAVFIRYPQNYDGIMSSICMYAPGKCLVFPRQKCVIAIPTVPSTISSIFLASMNNGMHICPITKYLNITVASSSMLQFYNINHTNLTTIKTTYLRNIANSMTITATQSPNIFLRNYLNTATIQLRGLYTDQYITAFYIHAPSDIVTFDSTYCNATLTSSFNNPYPTRLHCMYQNDTTIAVGIPEGVGYVYNATDDYVVTVNCKFMVQDFGVGQNVLYVSAPTLSGTFNAYGSHSAAVDDYHYYITEVSQTITISQHQVPPIGNIQFVTQGYSERFANINDTVSLDLLLDPTTNQPIKFIQIMLPEQFGYPPVSQHDACKMIARSTLKLSNCQQIRRDNQTFIRITPPYNYDNGPVIIQIASEDIHNWFTAPTMPGNWYNYTVSLYSFDGRLLQRQSSQNCSTIGGLQLFIPNMSVQSGRDALMEEIVDVSFVVGKLDMRQGYSDGLLFGDYYTEIHISFQNWKAYYNLLGSIYKNGTLIGCTVRGLTANRQIECLLVGGWDIEHEPTIIVTGYEWVPAYTNITISIANIVMLDSTIRNVLSVSVVLRKVGSWKQSFLYNPEQLILKATSNLAIAPFNFVDVGYIGANRVNKPTVFYLTINPSIDVTTYFIVKFPPDFISNQYNIFPYSCAQASRVQIFYRSDLIRIYPLSNKHSQGIQITYTIIDFPSTEYSIALSVWPLTIQAYNSYKQVHRQIVNLNFQSYACTLSFALIQFSSPYILDDNLVYTFEATIPPTPYNYQDNLTLAILFPPEYGSLLKDQTNCVVQQPLKCRIMSDSLVTVRNARQTNSTKMVINITGIVNPNQLNHTFTLLSYEGDNIDKVQCRSTTAVMLKNIDIDICSLVVVVSHISIGKQASYSFTLLCPRTFKNNSQIIIQLHRDYLLSNPLGKYSCWSQNPLNLLTSTCDLTYQNASIFLKFQNISIDYNQVVIVLHAALVNPIFPKQYLYSATSRIQNYIYATSNTIDVNFTVNQVKQMTNIDMVTVPSAAGSNSIYVLKLSQMYISQDLQIDFPFNFELASATSVSYHTSNNSNWHKTLSYFDLLQYSYQSTIPSTLTSYGNNLARINAYNCSKNQLKSNIWAFILIKFVVNPSYNNKNITFAIRSLSSNKQLQYIYNGPFSLQFDSPPKGIHFIFYSTSDNDLQVLAQHNITYQIDSVIYTNLTSFVLNPPNPEFLYAITELKCCLYINSQLIECNLCRVGKYQIQYSVMTQGLTLQENSFFTIQIMKLFTSDRLNDCISFQDFKRSYFHLMVFRNKSTLTHQSIGPSADHFTPCQQLQPIRGDTLFNPPNILYAGMTYKIPLSITRPSKMLRITLKSLSYDLIFKPNLTYFNSYDVVTQWVELMVQPSASPSFTYINVTHQQSIWYNIFRDNLPRRVQIRNDKIQYVIVQQVEACSIGRYITVPIILTWSASYDMYLHFTPSPITPLLEFQFTTIKIPANSKQTDFKFRYNGDKVPATINISMNLTSPFTLRHALKPQTVYFFFSVTEEFQTLPPVMKVRVMHQYQQNPQFASRKIYNLNTSGILYDQLRPYIIKTEDVQIGSTKASIRIFTRHEGEVYYLLKERGDFIPNLTSQMIRLHKESHKMVTYRNSSQYVNAYNIVNLTRLQHQTIYNLYAMVHDSLGDSQNYVVHTFMTIPLSNAVQLRLDSSQLIADSVYIVHRISQILNIDILRVKVIDSYVLLNQTYTKNRQFKNQINYRNQIVVSPSAVDDSITPLSLVNDQLISHAYNRRRLKAIMPEFVDNFDQRINTNQPEQLPLIQLNFMHPKVKLVPKAIKISYYNATFQYQLWSRAIISAVVIEQSQQVVQTLRNSTKQLNGSRIVFLADDIPYSKQIILGKTSYNKKADRSYNGSTDLQGKGSIRLSVLKPNTKYMLYITFSTWHPYQPIIYAQTKDIMQLSFFTLSNPSLKQNQEAYVLKELKYVDPELYSIIQQHRNQEKNRQNLK